MKQLKIKKDLISSIYERCGWILSSWFGMTYVYVLLCNMFRLDLPVTFPLLLATVFLVLYAVLFEWKGSASIVVRIVLAILPFFTFFLYGLKDQWQELWYQLQVSASEYGIYLGNRIPISSTSDYSLVCAILLCYWFGIFFLVVNQKADRLILCLLLGVSIGLMIRLHVTLPIESAFFLAGWMASVLLGHVIPAAGMGIVYLAVFVLLGFLPKADVNTFDEVKNLSYSKLSQSFEEKRYHKKQSVLPDGDLSLARSLERDDQIALKVTMEDPTSMYLRGFIGNVFQGKNWYEARDFLKTRQVGILPESEHLLDQLARQGYYSQNQMVHIAEIDDEIPMEYQSVHIENIDADTSYIYTPYEVGYDFFTLLDGTPGVLNQGEVLKATGYAGQKEYEYQVITTFPSWKRTWLKNRNHYAEDAEKNQNSISSIYKEQFYKEYVNRCFLNLSQETRELISSAKGIEGKYTEHVTPLVATETIRGWLSRYMNYGNDMLSYEEMNPSQTENSVERYLFSGEAEGNDIYYATAATLLYRYFGIPARYVEGYVITKDAVSQAKEQVDVYKSDAHAWVEIYIDNLGWIPVEVVPSYIEVMNSYLPDSGSTGLPQDRTKEEREKEEGKNKAPSKKPSSNKGSEDSTEDLEEEKDSDTTQNLMNEISKRLDAILNRPGSIPWLLILLGMVILIVIIAVFVFWQMISGKRKLLEDQWRTSKNNALCVCMWYRNLECLSSILIGARQGKNLLAILKMQGQLEDNRSMCLKDFVLEMNPECDEDLLKECISIRHKALYSRNDISTVDRDFVARILGQEVAILEEKLSFQEKIIYTILASRLHL